MQQQTNCRNVKLKCVYTIIMKDTVQENEVFPMCMRRSVVLDAVVDGVVTKKLLTNYEQLKEHVETFDKTEDIILKDLPLSVQAFTRAVNFDFVKVQ